MNNKEKLLEILIDINSDIDYEKENALVDDGIFDSLEVMTIVTEITEKFHVNIDPDDVIAENFNSLDMILNLLQKSLTREGLLND